MRKTLKNSKLATHIKEAIQMRTFFRNEYEGIKRKLNLDTWTIFTIYFLPQNSSRWLFNYLQSIKILSLANGEWRMIQTYKRYLKDTKTIEAFHVLIK